MKKNNGITLISLVLTIILMLLISGTMGYYTTSGLSLQKVNNMYSDIEQIQSKIDEYYIKNNEIPKLNQINFSNSQNVNDGSEYYVIDLSKLDNLSLNYGEEFEQIKTEGSIGTYTDVYIINEESQTIYYLNGIEFEDKRYYTKPLNYTEI